MLWGKIYWLLKKGDKFSNDLHLVGGKKSEDKNMSVSRQWKGILPETGAY